jgi:hypothetical protein
MAQRRDKKKVGRSIQQSERRLVNSISRGITAAAGASGAESAPLVQTAAAPDAESSIREVRAAQQGASTLFEIEKDGFVSALAILLVPHVLKEGSRRVAAVAQPFGFVCKLGSKERLAVVVPAGYVTDFASIPKAVHFIISPFGKHAEAAVVHDWLYTLGKPRDRKGRRIADKAFVKALRLLDVSWFTRQIMFWAVRFGGADGYGLAADFTFRNLEDLTIMDPPPSREPFMTSYATAAVIKSKRRAAAKAAATQTQAGVTAGPTAA